MMAWVRRMLWVWRFCRAGASWVIAATVFGLLPLWVRIGRSLLFPSVEVGWEAVLKDGLLLYFSMAIISAVTADYYLVDRRPYPKYSHFYMISTLACAGLPAGDMPAATREPRSDFRRLSGLKSAVGASLFNGQAPADFDRSALIWRAVYGSPAIPAGALCPLLDSSF